jgi:hypothetical protein
MRHGASAWRIASRQLLGIKSKRRRVKQTAGADRLAAGVFNIAAPLLARIAAPRRSTARENAAKQHFAALSRDVARRARAAHRQQLLKAKSAKERHQCGNKQRSGISESKRRKTIRRKAKIVKMAAWRRRRGVGGRRRQAAGISIIAAWRRQAGGGSEKWRLISGWRQ